MLTAYTYTRRIRALTIARALLGALAMVLLALPATSAKQVSEGQLKSAFIYNFLKFTTWDNTGNGPGSVLQLCVLGNDDVSESLPGLEGKYVGGRVVRVQRIDVPENMTSCDALYVSKGMVDQLDDVLAGAQKYKALTISSEGSFAQQGGMISFVRKKNRIGFQINNGEALKAGIQISSQLLKLADIVETKQ